MKGILTRLMSVAFVFGLVACDSSHKSPDEVAMEYIQNCFGGNNTEFLSNARGPNGTTLDKERLLEHTQSIAQLRSFAQNRGGLKSVSLVHSSSIPSDIYKNLTKVELKAEFHNGEVIDSSVRVILIDNIWRVLLD